MKKMNNYVQKNLYKYNKPKIFKDKTKDVPKFSLVKSLEESK